jgi:DNA replication protein DnaC
VLRWERCQRSHEAASFCTGRSSRSGNLTDLEIIHQLCDEERASRMKSAVDRRIKDAKFPELNTVDGFDFDFDPVRKKLRARYLALHAKLSAVRSAAFSAW